MSFQSTGWGLSIFSCRRISSSFLNSWSWKNYTCSTKADVLSNNVINESDFSWYKKFNKLLYKKTEISNEQLTKVWLWVANLSKKIQTFITLSHLEWLVCNYLKNQFRKTMNQFLSTISSVEIKQEIFNATCITLGRTKPQDHILTCKQNQRQSCKVSHLNKMGNSCWRLKDNPFIYSNSLLIIILLNGNITSKEQETVWRNFCAVIQVYL